MAEPAKMDVEAMTRKRARVAAAIKKFRVTALVITACTKLSSGRGIRCDLEVEGDFSEEPEQARSEIESELLAVLSTQLSSARLDEEPSSEESFVASRHAGHCIAHPEAQGKMLLPPPATNVGFLSNPTHDQQERSGTFEQAVGTMFTSPNDGPGFLSVHSRGQVTAEGEKSEQDEQDEWEMVDYLAPTADCASENIPNQWHPTREREESGQYEQHMSPNAEAWPLAYLFKEAELASFDDMFEHAPPPIARLEELGEDSLHVAITPVSTEGDSIQRGINDQLLGQVDPNPQEQTDPNPQQQNHPNPQEQNDHTPQVDPNRQEQVDPNPQEQTDPNPQQQNDPNPQEQNDHTPQEQRGHSELGSQPIPVLRKRSASNTKKKIEKIFEEFDPAPCRQNLLDVQSKVTENSNNLKSTDHNLLEQLQDFSNNLGTLLNNLWNGVALSNVGYPRTEQEELARQQQQQELIRNIFQVIDHFFKSIIQISLSLIEISNKLDGLVKPLEDVGMQTITRFQSCAESVYVTLIS